MLTDPQLNAWYDQKGDENADKCAWTFNGLVTIGGQSWKIQGNWSNAAANAHTRLRERRLHRDELTLVSRGGNPVPPAGPLAGLTRFSRS